MLFLLANFIRLFMFVIEYSFHFLNFVINFLHDMQILINKCELYRKEYL